MHYRFATMPARSPSPSPTAPADPSPEELVRVIAAELRCLPGRWCEPCPDGSGRLLLTRDGEYVFRLAEALRDLDLPDPAE